MAWRRGFAGAALLAVLAGPAQAQSLDLSQGGPIEITASDGIEWRQQDQAVIARGDARATRGVVAVDADRLIARYRPRGGAAQPAPAPAAQGAASNPVGASEIWRIEAEGRVRITSQTERATGERAVYDLDQAVMVLSGQGLALETPDQRIAARESLEYWPQRRMAVARGGAVVTTTDNRRIAADTLVAYFAEGPAPGPQSPAQAAPATRPGGLPGGEGSRIERVEAFGSVEIRTPEEVVRGERGAYAPPTGLATLSGGVRITRGDNQLNGQEAIVDLRSGLSRLVSAPGQRVQGLIVQQQAEPSQAQVPPAGRPQPQPRQPLPPTRQEGPR
ncbi:LptA/OstA family protein [Falsiroseomonas sp.]|uniref:LptA/OstA family protein n=1 Tax=Falsiroseomonas sp. TaxID=2870721 RepID=UPI0034A5D182